MEEVEDIKTKVLVYDNEDVNENKLKSFYDDFNLLCLKACNNDPMQILDKNIDLGAIVIAEDYAFEGVKADEMARLVNRNRPELPIFMRMCSESSTLPQELNHIIADSFHINDRDKFLATVSKHLFTRYYPMPLIQGIQEVSLESIRANIKNCDIAVTSPYLVKDQIIYGELLSLIPMESNWYRGYMMLQTTFDEAIGFIKHGYTTFDRNDADPRHVISLLNEVTNLIWGGIKSRFNMYDDKEEDSIALRTQVPISINHHQKFISFGTTEPQLCFHYVVKDLEGKFNDIDLYQKFVFNLSWYPEDFKQCGADVDELVDSGELEFF